MATLDDIQSTFLTAVGVLSDLVNATLKQVPSDSSGHLDDDKVVQTGFVRVTSVDVVVAGAAGGLYDAALIADAGSSNLIHVVPATLGSYPVNLVFTKGLVYLPGAAQEVAIMYTRL